jgi:ribonuclease HI
VAWIKPYPGSYKLNIDAAYYTDGPGAAGAVLRNNKGQAMARPACPLEQLIGPDTAEAMALLKGLEFLEQLGCSLGCSLVMVESDSLELIQACNGETEVWSHAVIFT